jgi:hypothetical protein
MTYFYGMDASNNVNNLYAEVWTIIAFVGHMNGKGLAVTAEYAATAATFPPATTLFT